jgi:hypothetical protein
LGHGDSTLNDVQDAVKGLRHERDLSAKAVEVLADILAEAEVIPFSQGGESEMTACQWIEWAYAKAEGVRYRPFENRTYYAGVYPITLMDELKKYSQRYPHCTTIAVAAGLYAAVGVAPKGINTRELRYALAMSLNIPEQAKAYVKVGDSAAYAVEDETVDLENGTLIEFVKSAGMKGCCIGKKCQSYSKCTAKREDL